MIKASWGLLGPEKIASERRARTLGLGAATRSFNDLGVPGIGGVWFCKQLYLATLGIQVAEKAREAGKKVTNIEVANAIEALACLLNFTKNQWARDSRLRGNTKLQGHHDAKLSFQKARQQRFYVTHPLRMASVQALPALGLVKPEGSRFNAYALSHAGKDFLSAACNGAKPYNRNLNDHLTRWVCGNEDRVTTSDIITWQLSPTQPLPEHAKTLLRERLRQGGHGESDAERQRRSNALDWVNSHRHNPPSSSWNEKPDAIATEHWADLRAGGLFFATRDAALITLDTLEAWIGNQKTPLFSLDSDIPDDVAISIDKLASSAQAYLALEHQNPDARLFCEECSTTDPAVILKNLAKRDDRVLRLVDDGIRPGSAYSGLQQAESGPTMPSDEDSPDAVAGEVRFPDGISYRIRNLYLLNLDLHGELDALLASDEIQDETL